MFKNPLLLTSAAVLLLAGSASLSANSETFWTGDGIADTNWTSGINWDGGTVPNNGGGLFWDVTIGDGAYAPEVTLDADITVNRAHLVGGTLFGEGQTLTAVNIDIGIFAIGGSEVRFAGNTTLGSLGEDNWLMVNYLSSLTNEGTFRHFFVDDTAYATGVLTLDGGAFVNEGSYQLTTDTISPQVVIDGWGGTFTNAVDGDFTKSGAGHAVIASLDAFVNHGQLTVEAGTLEIATGTGMDAHTGSFSVMTGAVLEFALPDDINPIYMAAGSEINGGGTVNVVNPDGVFFEAGSSLNVEKLGLYTTSFGDALVVFESGSSFDAGLLELDGGEIELEINAEVDSANLYLGRIAGEGAFTVNGDAEVRDLTVEGGTKTFAGTTTFTDSVSQNEASLKINGNTEVINRGTFIHETHENNTTSEILLNANDGTVESTFRNAAGATYRITGKGDSRITTLLPLADNSFINEGTFVKAGEGTARVGYGVVLENSGTLEVAEGKLVISGDLNNSGNVLLTGGTLSQRFDVGGALSNVAAESGTGTQAGIVEGTVASHDTYIDIAFLQTVESGESFSIGERRVSDVLSFTHDGDTFVYALAMTLDLTVSDDLYLGWLNDDGLWVNATEPYDDAQFYGDISYEAFRLAHTGALGDYLGAWGGTGNEVWAILDHQSEFSVVAIPEPGTWAMALSGIGALLWLGRRRQRTA